MNQVGHLDQVMRIDLREAIEHPAQFLRSRLVAELRAIQRGALNHAGGLQFSQQFLRPFLIHIQPLRHLPGSLFAAYVAPPLLAGSWPACSAP